MDEPDDLTPPPLRVLLVEDDVAHAIVVTDMLADGLDAAQVQVANDLQTARAAMLTPPDVVVASLALPEADSLEVVQSLRTACPDTVIVLLAWHDSPAFALAAITAGADDVLLKDDDSALVLTTAVQHAVQRRRAQSQIHRRERYAASLLDAGESISCAVDEHGVIVSTNASWRAFALANGGELHACGVGTDYLEQCDDAVGERRDGAAEIAAGVRAVLSGDVERFEHEYSCHAPDRQRWFSARVQSQPDGTGAVISHIDVTASRLADRAAARRRLHDPVTGLPNAHLLNDRLEQALAEGARSGRLVAISLVEIAQAADVEHQHGTAARDLLLVDVAGRLTACLREQGTVGQVGPDRFAIVWGELDSHDELRLRQAELLGALTAPVRLPVGVVHLQPRLGGAVDQWAQTAEDLLLAAAADLRAPASGRAAVSVPRPRNGERQRTEGELRTALERGELVVHYQPVIDLEGGLVVGVEALVRWQHPEDGLIGPDQFIPVAESGGLIVALGTSVLEQACRQAVLWRDAGHPLQVAVNLSTRQVAHPDLLRTVQRVLRETGLAPGQLVLEVTESAMMADVEAATVTLNAIAGLGVLLAIDDFGTGFGPLVYLKRYPITALKVDRSFVRGMRTSCADDAIVASVIGLARAFGGVCIAEGVETREQFVDLVLLGCKYGQGWLFGAAVSPDDLPDLVERCQSTLEDLLLLVPEGAALRDRAGEQRDSAAGRRDVAGDDRDEAGDARDVVADRRDLVAGQRDAAARRRDRAGDERDEVGLRRDVAGSRRDDVADERDRLADSRDRAADLRDRAADQRDRSSDAHEQDGVARVRREAAADRVLALQDRHAGASERSQAEQDRGIALADRGAGADERGRAVLDRDTAQADRGAGAQERDRALVDRATALADRGAGAGLRLRAQRDRDDASADRGAASRERDDAALDPLTGALQRGAGLDQLAREVARARRSGESLVLAFIDVDGLKAVNDGHGHAAGDEVLARVAVALRRALREYDLVVRYGGDEFLCVLPGIELAQASARMASVNASLGDDLSVSCGLTALRPEDGVHQLVVRADTELYRVRGAERPV